LPEDFKWFKKMTTGHVIVMGRKTYESIGKPLPNRTTIVLSRSPLNIPGVRTIADLRQLDSLEPELAGREIFICGGAQVYQQALPLCSDLYLTLVNRTVEGDAFFPAFEERFVLKEEILEQPDFKILHYQRSAGREVVMTPELEKILDEGMQDLHKAKTTDELRRPQ
jgi:dihydrofolate reductase